MKNILIKDILGGSKNESFKVDEKNKKVKIDRKNILQLWDVFFSILIFEIIDFI